jgi:hypothetical protein
MIKRIVVLLVLAVSTDAFMVFRMFQPAPQFSDENEDARFQTLYQRMLHLRSTLDGLRNLRHVMHAEADKIPTEPIAPIPLRAPIASPVAVTPPPPLHSPVTFGSKLGDVLEVFFILGLVVGILAAIYLYRSHSVPLSISSKVLKDAVELRYHRPGGYGSADQRVAD